MDLKASSTCWSCWLELIDYCTLFPVLFICLFFVLFVWFIPLVSYSRFVSQLWNSELHWPSWNLCSLNLVMFGLWWLLIISLRRLTFELQTEFLLSAWLLLLILSLHFYPTLKQRANCCTTSKNKNNRLIKKRSWTQSEAEHDEEEKGFLQFEGW